LNRKLKVQETVVANITKLYSEYEKGFNHGEISILDINKLKIELLNTKRAYDELVSQRAGLFEKLTSLNGNKEIENLSSLYDYPTQSLESLDYYLAEVIKYDPSYLTLVANLDASNQNLSSAKLGWLPDLALSYKYSNEMGSKFNGFAVGVSVPIFANRNKVSASKSELIAAELTQKDVLAELESAIKTHYSHIVTAKSQIHSYNNVLESGNNEKMLQKALEGGQISLLDYLLELRYFLEAQQTLLDLEFEYNTLMTDLNKYQLLN
jgi:outer membrane protein TolC